MKKNLFILIAAFILSSPLYGFGAEDMSMPRGVWVTVFSAKKVLYSRQSAQELIRACKDAGINEIYLQVYQGGKAFYDSGMLERSKYRDLVKSAGTDPVDFIINEAARNKIRVFAWINLLSLGKNEDSDIVKKFGTDILTRDQYARTTGRSDPDVWDKYYMREDLLFLEPGDARVAKFLIAVADEIIRRYPKLAGIHLDYARYPMTVPFIPGSKFMKFGLSYGYAAKNTAHFKEVEGLDPAKLKSEREFQRWDDWRRKQVTMLVKRIAKQVRQRNPAMLVSCAVIPSAERAYTAIFQDWPFWLEEGYLDYVVLMSYSQDDRLSKEVVRSALAQRSGKKVYVGIGVFLFKDNQDSFREQCKMVKSLSPDGIVLFSYDDLTSGIAASLKE